VVVGVYAAALALVLIIIGTVQLPSRVWFVCLCCKTRAVGVVHLALVYKFFTQVGARVLGPSRVDQLDLLRPRQLALQTAALAARAGCSVACLRAAAASSVASL
jgi:hypothetical protein